MFKNKFIIYKTSTTCVAVDEHTSERHTNAYNAFAFDVHIQLMHRLKKFIGRARWYAIRRIVFVLYNNNIATQNP